jgi:membrane-bound lytic murein transglycosylase B
MRLRAAAAMLALPGILAVGMLGPSLDTNAASSSPQRLAVTITGAQARMASAAAATAQLRGLPAPGSRIERLRRDMQVANSEFGFRNAARTEQEVIYQLAADSHLESQVISNLPRTRAAGLADAAEAMRSLWRLAGIGDFNLARVRHSKNFRASEPVDSLHAYYTSAGARYGIEWTYLAAINYVESDFGRTNGPSSAGALGPMQFLPSTWQTYGAGDIMNPRDSITAAAYYLSAQGAPENYERALLAYNHDAEYVAAVEHFAAALGSDSLWLSRLYYWSTFG